MASAPRRAPRARKGGPGNLARLFYADVARALRIAADRPDCEALLGLPDTWLRVAASALDRAAEGLGPELQDGRVDAGASRRRLVLACVERNLRSSGKKTKAVEDAAEALGLSVSAVWSHLRIARKKRTRGAL